MTKTMMKREKEIKLRNVTDNNGNVIGYARPSFLRKNNIISYKNGNNVVHIYNNNKSIGLYKRVTNGYYFLQYVKDHIVYELALDTLKQVKSWIESEFCVQETKEEKPRIAGKKPANKKTTKKRTTKKKTTKRVKKIENWYDMVKAYNN